MLLKKDATIHIVPIPRVLLLNDKLRHIEHDLRAELTDLKELDHWLRISCVLSIDHRLEVIVQTTLSFICITFRHEQLLWRESW